ncbi:MULTISPECIES: Sec-independent protein translocase protein TatB [Helicobacter]|uniref:Sec-independent protein translocase protein TatB n=1 Tax=Helicobacter TaxID=209 RepID=UPI00202A070C|nr:MULTISPECIES: Sec-independent protein translocase protein TatB [Helicobacter]MCI7765162.1 Sec-independent protein translocase protein TatB [Helicobacter sp.]MCL9822778.1 Sec-independent protein translocase protein TatB [Helicobacter colisuis]
MFGMGFFEILVIAAVAIIFLGPEKLPKALVDVAKFIKAVKRTMDDAKESLDREVNLNKIKEDALAYKNSLTQGVENLTKEMDLKELSSLDFEEDLKPQISETKEAPLTPNNTNPQTSNVKEGVKPLQTKQTLSFKEDAKSEEKSIKNQ